MINFIYFKMLKLFVSLLNFIYFLKSNKKENRLVNLCDKYHFSTTTKINLRDNLNVLKKIRENKVNGDFVECGVWKGISLVFLQKYIEIYNLKNTKVYGFDTFEGLPADWHNEKEGNYSAEGVIPRIDGGIFVAGKFEDTLPIFLTHK